MKRRSVKAQAEFKCFQLTPITTKQNGRLNFILKLQNLLLGKAEI